MHSHFRYSVNLKRSISEKRSEKRVKILKLDVYFSCAFHKQYWVTTRNCALGQLSGKHLIETVSFARRVKLNGLGLAQV